MKVLSYLEFYSMKFDEQLDYLNQLNGTDYKLDDYKYSNKAIEELGFLNDYYYKVKRIFTPELITELFEGWAKHDTISYYQFTVHVGILFYTNDNSYQLSSMVFPSTPRTLDDFINDAARAGIILKWRIKE